jgi:hypothetical protein
MDNPEMIEKTEDKDPIFFAPKRVSIISDTANVLSWIVLVAFVGDVVAQILGLRAQLVSYQITFTAALKEINFYILIFQNVLVPLLTGLGLFAILQGVSLGLSMMLESDYNMREEKD